MKRETKNKIHSSESIDVDGLEQLHNEIDNLILQSVDEATFVSRPPDAGESYGERYFEFRRLEQPELHAAVAAELSRPHRENAAAAEVDADAEETLMESHKPAMQKSWTRFDELSELLVGTIARTMRDKHAYHARMILLLVGDVVAIGGGLINQGEIPALALVQAIAAGVAAVTSGLLAAEIKKARQARERQRDEASLTELQQRHAYLFRGPDAGEFLVKGVVGFGLVIVVLIGLGVFMLRSTTQGSAAGIVFSSLAIAVALASWANTYAYTDEWRDVLDVAHEEATRNTVKYQALTALPARREFARHSASIASIQDEFDHRAKAAALHISAEKQAWLTKFPGVVGHGFKSLQKIVPPMTELVRLLEGEEPQFSHHGHEESNASGNGNGKFPGSYR